MAWYKTGTISVTNGSATVNGSGTLWVDSGVLNPGDVVQGPDGKLYEILSIQSNTQLTLASNYLGTTLSGQAYAIMPIGLLPSALAQQVKSVLSTANTALASAVRFDSNSQGLTGTQQQNARTNINAIAPADVGQGRVSMSVAGNTDVTLNAAQDAAEFLQITGALTGNINLIVTTTARHRFIDNQTSGNFTVTVKTPSGTGISAPQGYLVLLECDGTNVVNPITNIPGTLRINGGLSLAAYVASNLYRPLSAANTGSSGNWFSLGTITFDGQSSNAEIVILGTQGYSSGSAVVGKTTIRLRLDNANGLSGAYFFGESSGAAVIQGVAVKLISGTTWQVWVNPGSFYSLDPFIFGEVTQSINIADTGSASQPAGSTLLTNKWQLSMGSNNQIQVDSSANLTATGGGSFGNNTTVTGGTTAPSTGASNVYIRGGSNIPLVGYVDATRSANNKIVESIWTGGILTYRFTNDAYNTVVEWLKVSGGQAAGLTYVDHPTGPVCFSGVGTTASAANAFLNNASSPANSLLRSTSSLKYKTDLIDLTLEEARNITFGRHSFSYKSKSPDDNPDQRWIGYGAEEIAPIDTRFVTFDEQGDVSWVQYERFVVPHGIILDDHEARIAQLSTRLAEALDVIGDLRTRVEALEARP